MFRGGRKCSDIFNRMTGIGTKGIEREGVTVLVSYIKVQVFAFNAPKQASTLIH